MSDDVAWLRWHLDPRNQPDPGRPSTGSAVALYGQLSVIPGQASTDGPVPKGFESRVPIDSHVSAMLDRRTRPEKPGDVMSLWAVLHDAADRFSAPPHAYGMARLPSWLYPRSEALLAVIPGILRDVRVCHRQMCAVLGEPAPAVVGRCTECGAPLRYTSGHLTCRSCGASWDLDAILETVK